MLTARGAHGRSLSISLPCVCLERAGSAEPGEGLKAGGAAQVPWGWASGPRSQESPRRGC